MEERDQAFKEKIMLLNQRIEDIKDHISKLEKSLEEEESTKASNDLRIHVCLPLKI